MDVIDGEEDPLERLDEVATSVQPDPYWMPRIDNVDALIALGRDVSPAFLAFVTRHHSTILYLVRGLDQKEVLAALPCVNKLSSIIDTDVKAHWVRCAIAPSHDAGDHEPVDLKVRV